MSAQPISGQERLPAAPVQGHAGGLRDALVQKLCHFWSDCAWTSLAGKVAIGIGAFFALALVGSGKATDLLPADAAKYLGPPATAAPTSGVVAVDAGAMPVPQAPAASPDGGPPEASQDAGVPGPQPATERSGTAAGAGLTADGKVILNLATEEDLRKLPGIGPSKAKAILALRQKLGRFRRVEDLLRVKGIGRKSLGRLRPRLLVDPPA